MKEIESALGFLVKAIEFVLGSVMKVSGSALDFVMRVSGSPFDFRHLREIELPVGLNDVLVEFSLPVLVSFEGKALPFENTSPHDH